MYFQLIGNTRQGVACWSVPSARRSSAFSMRTFEVFVGLGSLNSVRFLPRSLDRANSHHNYFSDSSGNSMWLATYTCSIWPYRIRKVLILLFANSTYHQDFWGHVTTSNDRSRKWFFASCTYAQIYIYCGCAYVGYGYYTRRDIALYREALQSSDFS